MEGTRLSDLKTVDPFAGPTPPPKGPSSKRSCHKSEWALPVRQGLVLEGHRWLQGLRADDRQGKGLVTLTGGSLVPLDGRSLQGHCRTSVPAVTSPP